MTFVDIRGTAAPANSLTGVQQSLCVANLETEHEIQQETASCTVYSSEAPNWIRWLSMSSKN